MNKEEVKKTLHDKVLVLENSGHDIELIFEIVDLYMKLSDDVNVVKYANMVLDIDTENQRAKNYIEQIKMNKRFMNTDHFESPNMGFDPWLD